MGVDLASFASFMGTMGKMHEICMIHSLFMEFSADGQQSESIEAKVDEFCSKLHKICVIHCKFKSKKKFRIFTCSFRRHGIEKCVRPCRVLFG